ncbi:hypothetical protein NDU88_003484 [Pleurodeles waltl]|uniref:Uncharacterized protein n=1 Tax=Pleurodeles waltl TaxID=8319 RepID=A0AAV7VFP7_PLEWA|nr:hypothetical protein NDU88_003484 [Pleurodeles waltl]
MGLAGLFFPYYRCSRHPRNRKNIKMHALLFSTSYLFTKLYVFFGISFRVVTASCNERKKRGKQLQQTSKEQKKYKDARSTFLHKLLVHKAVCILRDFVQRCYSVM